MAAICSITFVFLYETGKWDKMFSKNKRKKYVQVVQRQEVDPASFSNSNTDTLLEEDENLLIDTLIALSDTNDILVLPEQNYLLIANKLLVENNSSNANPPPSYQSDTLIADNNLHPAPAPDTSVKAVLVKNVTPKVDTLLKTVYPICGMPFDKNEKKYNRTPEEDWFSLLMDLNYADKFRARYIGCVSEYLEQPYATFAMAVSTLYAYEQDDLYNFNFLGERIWGKKKFNNASEYFNEFARIFNPDDIEDEYFEDFKEMNISADEQRWRAYMKKNFPNAPPNTIRTLMRRWGYGFTET